MGAWLIMSYYDASLTAPGVQNEEVDPGAPVQLAQVEDGALVLGTLFQSSSAGCSFEEKASEELVDHMRRYARSYELEHGCKRSPSRLRQWGPRATAFFAYTPSCCASSAWMLYKLFQDKWAVRYSAAQPSRMFGVSPYAPELRETVYGSFAFRFAARAQALLQLLVYMWLSLMVSLKKKVAATDFLASSLAVRQRRMIQGSVSSGPYESLQSFGPRGYNSVLDSVAGALARALIANVKDPRASKLRRCLGGTALGAGGSHFVFPSDCFARSCRGSFFDGRDEVNEDDREDLRTQLVAEWKCLEAEWVAGDKSEVAR